MCESVLEALGWNGGSRHMQCVKHLSHAQPQGQKIRLVVSRGYDFLVASNEEVCNSLLVLFCLLHVLLD